MTLRNVLDSLAEGTPAPGGGAATALTGAVGASLVLMVARLPQTRAATSGSVELASVVASLLPARDELMALVEKDAAAYAAVLHARGLPALDPAQTATRRRAIDAAVVAATDTQLEVIAWCSACLRDALAVAAHCATSARTDLQVGIELLRTSARTAAMTATANLPLLRDESLIERLRTRCNRLEREAVERAEAATAQSTGS